MFVDVGGIISSSPVTTGSRVSALLDVNGKLVADMFILVDVNGIIVAEMSVLVDVGVIFLEMSVLVDVDGIIVAEISVIVADTYR